MASFLKKIKFKYLAYFLFLAIIISQNSFSQDKSIKIKILSSLQTQTSEYKASEANGYGLGAQMNFRVIKNLDLGLKIHYDFLSLEQRDVLDEWDWDYWRDTYIDFLPGAEPEIVNQTLKHTSTDSIYSAVFDPTQSLKELRLFTGLEYQIPVSKRIGLLLGLDAGLSLFYRELKMQEHWTKRFKLDTLSTEKFDYEFQYDLLHFAPTKKGTMIFASPSIGAKFNLSSSLDLVFGMSYLHYFHREKILGIKLSENGRKWYPIKSKTQVMVGLIFKY